MLHLADRSLDEIRLVKGNVQFHALGQGLADVLEFFLDPANYLHSVCSGLFLYTDAYGGCPVESGDRALFLHTVFCPTHIAHPDRRTLVVTDDEVVELLDCRELALDLDRVLLGIAFDPAAGQFYVFSLQGPQHILCRNAVGHEAIAVQPYSCLS
ncbi:MAG: hypothetical protein A4E62_01920 [Syntrophorhabdus sp. PtaU1.Bin002]|nr:MAG: hypothetical protein A4E62_01920 [Syntrophorhabdus sp. PtaU1.Bin002]